MIINEDLVDKRIQQAARWYGNSDTFRKLTGYAAYYVVGNFSDATQQIAAAAKCDVDTIANWAHAVRLYKHIRKDPIPAVAVLARRLWRKLPISFWYTAYSEIHQRGWNALYYLDQADLNDWSVRDMRKEFQVDWERENGAPPPVPFERKWQKARAAFTNLLADFDELCKRMTAQQVDALRVVVEAFGTEAK